MARLIVFLNESFSSYSNSQPIDILNLSRFLKDTFVGWALFSKNSNSNAKRRCDSVSSSSQLASVNLMGLPL
ncbi:hypothetical protein HanHA300_Chr17g0649751 [Helianthus annuus]|nr:hypothetical protein HanHA300_Chr17g0649751 [Helianthus annuus]KAJ0635888.1 hypothetical protein HanOQP8_Chr17g0655771 [Helianthus annuus]